MKKKLSCGLLALTMAFNVVPISECMVYAQGDGEDTTISTYTGDTTGGTTSDDFTYTIDTVNNFATITGNNSHTLTEVTIPTTVSHEGQTYYVNAIGESAFLYKSTIEKVTLPSDIKTIGEKAFYGSTSLTDVIITISGSLETIGNNAFYNCTSLESITLPNNLTTIGERAFQNCTKLARITIPDKVTSIGDYVFSGCEWLTTATLPDSLTSIGKQAFSNCERLQAISIPDGVTEILESTFFGCSLLETVSIPNSVTSIGDGAFRDCSTLTSITLPRNLNTIGSYAFYNLTEITSLTIPDSVTSIGGGAFSYTGITTLTIPEGVTTLNDYLLSYCDDLVTLHLPKSLTSIGTAPFIDCTSLTDIYFAGTEEEWKSIENISSISSTITVHYGDTPNTTLPNLPTPTITGTAKVGETLTVAVADVDLDGYAIQWYADGEKITDATSSTLTLAHAQLGAKITVGVTAPSSSEVYNSTESVSTATSGVIAEYTITFTGADPEDVKTGDDATVSTLPTGPSTNPDAVEGKEYTFAGWYNGNDKVTTSTVFEGDTVVTAKFIEVTTPTFYEGKTEVGETGDTEIAIDLSSLNLSNDATEIVITVDGSITALENFIITSLPSVSVPVTVEIPSATATGEDLVWTIPAKTALSNVNLAVTLSNNTDHSNSNSGYIQFAHSGDLVTGGTGLTLQFPVPTGTVSSSDTIKLTKREDTSKFVSGTCVDSSTIKATFTTCSIWDISINSNSNVYTPTTTTTTNSNSNTSTYNSGTGAFYTYSGNVSVNGSYIAELRGILLGEMVNLDKITTVNGLEVLGWYYDSAFTQPVENTSTFVFTENIINNGLYAKTTASTTLVDGSYNAGAGGVTSGLVDSSASTNTNTSYVPSAVPSTIAKLLGKLF